MKSVAEIFGHDGVLAAHLQGFTFRESQLRMAELVNEALRSSSHAVIEAGTGIGKTYAYLIPALLSGRRTIVSTGTKTLQDQLFSRDLPALGAALGRPVRVALLKGRANYLCWHRLELALADTSHDSRARDLLRALVDWANGSTNGDLSNLADLDADFQVRAAVTSTVDNCLGGKCPAIDRCFVADARQKAQAAQVVIVNHHLLLADLALKEAGFGELLGEADTVIVDEAHLLPDIAQQFFGISISSREIEALARDIHAELQGGRIGEEASTGLMALSSRAASLRTAANVDEGRLVWSETPAAIAEAWAGTASELARVADSLGPQHDTPAGIDRCIERCRELMQRINAILEADDSGGLRWLEVARRSIRMHWTPLDIGASLGARIEEHGSNWIFASATLAVGDRFDHFVNRVGLTDALTGVFASPFDYRKNARFYFPQGLPDPRHDDYTTTLMSMIWPLIEASGGGAFLLFTSYRALNIAEAWIKLRRTPGPLLVQASAPRSQLLEQFRGANAAVLLGTSSFWQGVDVRGQALRVVVIDKLPFAAPNDPLIQARGKEIRRRGGDPFSEFQLPQAVLALKQGVGRLIRDYDDRGLIVIGDPRLRTRGYGRAFLESMPNAPELDSFEAALAFAATLHPEEVDLNEAAVD